MNAEGPVWKSLGLMGWAATGCWPWGAQGTHLVITTSLTVDTAAQLPMDVCDAIIQTLYR